MDTGARQPDYSVLVNNNDITTDIKDLLISLSVIDNRGFEADTIELVLDDTDGRIDMPPRGGTVQVALGWKGSPLVDKGSYTIDEIRHQGPPDTLIITGTAADMRAGLQKLHEESYTGVTLKQIVEIIAARHDLESMVDERWHNEMIEHIDQQNESDAGFLTRLAKDYDAIATVKSSRLLFIKAGESKTASGITIENIEITRDQADTHNFAVSDRESYTGVTAQWQNNDKAKVEDEEVSGSSNEYTAGDSENIKVLRHVYATEKNAKRAANAEWDKLQRGAATFTITLAEANPNLYPETPIRVKGYKRQIDSTEWILVRVSHSLSDSGFNSALEMEVKNTAIPD